MDSTLSASDSRGETPSIHMVSLSGLHPCRSASPPAIESSGTIPLEWLAGSNWASKEGARKPDIASGRAAGQTVRPIGTHTHTHTHTHKHTLVRAHRDALSAGTVDASPINPASQLLMWAVEPPPRTVENSAFIPAAGLKRSCQVGQPFQ